MNALGLDRLRQAGLAGVPQVFGQLAEGKGLCALGVLGWIDLGLSHVASCDLYALSDTHMDCAICGDWQVDEANLIVHYNDEHKADFLKIASLLPESGA